MLRTDTGNFNRFLTSLGLLLLAAALVIPYFYFRNTDILTIPGSDLGRMTEQGRSALAGRQNAIADLEPWVVGGAITLALVGAVLLVAGGLRLRAAQASEDEETELRKDRARLEMQSLSPEERVEKTLEKAREGAREESEDRPPTEAPAPDRAEGTAVKKEPQWLRSFDETIQRRQRAVERIEQGVEGAFEAASPINHRLKLQLKISSTDDAIQLDGVFEAHDNRQPDVVLKTRAAFNPDILTKSARSVADELISQSSRYQAMTHRVADGWLVVVVPAESEANLDSGAVNAATASLDSALGTLGKASVVRESELGELPRLFAASFGHTYLL